MVSGGVASNRYVRARLNDVAGKNGLELVCPPPGLCTDNGNFTSVSLPFTKQKVSFSIFLIFYNRNKCD